MYWKYPELIHLIEYRTIEGITPVYISIKNTENKYREHIKNNKLLIGYVIETTTGLITDKTLCMYRFLESWLRNKNLINLLHKHRHKTCIIDCYSESWGEKKVVSGTNVLTDWVKEFLTEEKLNKPIIIEDNLDLRIIFNLSVQ